MENEPKVWSLKSNSFYYIGRTYLPDDILPKVNKLRAQQKTEINKSKHKQEKKKNDQT